MPYSDEFRAANGILSHKIALVSYACFFIALAFLGSLACYGEYKQRTLIEEYKKTTEERQAQKERKYREFYQKIFSPGGIADTNFDLKVDDLEIIKMYKRLGFNENVLVPGKEFPKPSLEQLEKIIKEYYGDN